MPQKKESNPVRKLNNLSAVVQAHPTLVRQNLNMDSQTFCKIHIERVTTYIFYKKKKNKDIFRPESVYIYVQTKFTWKDKTWSCYAD